MMQEPPSEISLSRRYGVTRAQDAAWPAAYSLQFEFGPLSEASIGNVGKGPETTGWSALDRFLVKWIEARAKNRLARASLRLLF